MLKRILYSELKPGQFFQYAGIFYVRLEKDNLCLRLSDKVGEFDFAGSSLVWLVDDVVIMDRFDFEYAMAMAAG